jgi:competence protein ComEA
MRKLGLPWNWLLCGVLAGLACVSGGKVHATPPQRAPQPKAAPGAPVELVDLNSAPAAQLRALPGMGDAYVRRIIDGRPYAAKNQLVTRGVLPAPAYDRIKDLIVARRVLNQTR